MKNILLLVLALSILACAPVIAHSPDVKSGLSGGVSAVLGSGPTYENGDDPGPLYFGAAMASIAYGFRPEKDTRPAVRVGLQGPTVGNQAIDVYVQAPRSWFAPVATSAGIGLLAEGSDGRRMPYVQAGIKSHEGFGLDVAIGRYSARSTKPAYLLDERAQVNWLSFEVPTGRLASLYLRGGFASGHVTKRWTMDTSPYVDENRWVKLFGASIEIHR